MSDWERINKSRCGVGKFKTDESDGWNGLFEVFACGEFLRIIASDGEGWKHVSISRKYSNEVPTWEMMCFVKDLFFQPEDWVMQFHPAMKEYINNHPGCLHLWKPDAAFPTPPHWMVGIK